MRGRLRFGKRKQRVFARFVCDIGERICVKRECIFCGSG